MRFSFWQIIQYLSLDIVVGAIILLRFFSDQSGIFIEWPVYFLLASALWIIYTMDHLNDARRARTHSRGRYVFHGNYRLPILVAMLLVFFSAIKMLFYVPYSVIIGGVIIFGFCMVYLLVHHQLAAAGIKEIFAALIYSAGIFLAPSIYSRRIDILNFSLLFILATLNLLIFSWMEKDDDERDGFSSIATKIGYKKTKTLIICILSTGLLLAAFGVSDQPLSAGYFIFSLLLYGIVVVDPKWSKAQNRYRAIGDGVFILPILAEWF